MRYNFPVCNWFWRRARLFPHLFAPLWSTAPIKIQTFGISAPHAKVARGAAQRALARRAADASQTVPRMHQTDARRHRFWINLTISAYRQNPEQLRRTEPQTQYLIC